MAATAPEAVHGGADALGVPLHDFSTNSNACGPCPVAVAALQEADATHYPDPAYTGLRALLGALHGVDPARIVVAGSASEFIARVTALAVRRGAKRVALPAHAYGDYAHAAAAWGLGVCRHGEPAAAPAGLMWACEPSSPLGTTDPVLAQWSGPAPAGTLRVLDCAYAPLRLDAVPGNGADGPAAPASAPSAPAWAAGTWQLWTPNKALGLTGVRAAYAIAPAHAPPADLAALVALAPSWPLGAPGVALLQTWATPAAQRWLAGCLPTLRDWKAQQLALCEALGWQAVPGSLANYVVARTPLRDLAAPLRALRTHGIKLRDCASFGLAGHVRLGVLAPGAQQALRAAWPLCVPGAAAGAEG